jgi:hypothetical protein
MNQAKSLISIIIFSLACSPCTGTNAKDYFVYASQRLLASRATPCQLFFGDVDRLPQACCTKLGGSCHDVSCTECWRRTTATPWGVTAQFCSPPCGTTSNRTLSCRHANYFRLSLNGLAPVEHALIRAKPRLSYHVSTPPTAMAKQAPQRPGA